MEIRPQFECHCCTSNENVHICDLDNCDYPLCSTCKEKALKLEHKCPGCRRNIIVDINELEPDIDEHQVQIKCNHFCYSFTMGITTIIVSMCIFFIMCLMGRLVSQSFKIGPLDFFCFSTGEHYLLFLIGWSLLGFILGLFIVCCGGGLLWECLYSEL